MMDDMLREMMELQKRMDRMMEEMFREFSASPSRSERSQDFGYADIFREPKTDILEDDKEYVIITEIPGVDKKDIKVNVDGNVLKISAESKKEDYQKDKNLLRKERSLTKYYRTFVLPDYVDPKKAKATYKNGVLTIRFPKVKEKSGINIKVD